MFIFGTFFKIIVNWCYLVQPVILNLLSKKQTLRNQTDVIEISSRKSSRSSTDSNVDLILRSPPPFVGESHDYVKEKRNN